MNFLTLNNLGSLLTVVLAVLLMQRYRALPRARALPRYGWAGAILLFGAMAGAVLNVTPVKMFFTPLCWTGYILWADGAVAALRGRSLLSANRHAFALLAAASVPLWLIFELYNLRLANWLYVGLPSSLAIRYFAYVWAFSTIWPGVLETAALLRAMGWFIADFTTEDTESTEGKVVNAGRGIGGALPLASIVVGAMFLVIPPLLPQEVSVYLFGFVWLGPILLLEPLNLRAGRASLWADLRRDDATRLGALLAAGAICGLLWEFWNHAADARWIYTFPIFSDYRMFAMPLPGYLGFPAFALDCFAMYSLAEPALLRLTGTAPGSPAVLDLAAPASAVTAPASTLTPPRSVII